MNVPSLFTVSGIQAAWTQLLVAPLGVQILAALVGAAMVGLIGYGIYKAYKKYASPAKLRTEYDEELEAESLAPLISPKQPLKKGWFSQWWNRPAIIDSLGNKVEQLSRNTRQNFSDLDQKIDKLAGLLRSNSTSHKEELANVKVTSGTEFTALKKKFSQTDSRLDTVDETIKGLEDRIRKLEAQVKAYGTLKAAAFNMEKAAFAFRDAYEVSEEPATPTAANEERGPSMLASERPLIAVADTAQALAAPVSQETECPSEKIEKARRVSIS